MDPLAGSPEGQTSWGRATSALAGLSSQIPPDATKGLNTAEIMTGLKRYADWYESQPDDHDEMAESAEVPSVPVSRRLGHLSGPGFKD